MSNWQLTNKIDKIFDENIKEIPYEGTSVNSSSIKNSIIDLYEGIMKGLITYVMKTYTLTGKGYLHNEYKHIDSKEEIIENFLRDSL